MTTWTHDAVASSRFAARYEIWRAVEAQHAVSTMRFVDTLEEQHVLERILEQAKPRLRDDLAGLHYLLAAPFRYRPTPPGSRFRGPEDPGVFYGALAVSTACAEVGWWRWKGFLQDVPGLEGLPPVAFTVFPVGVHDETLDLMKEPLVSDRAAWTHPADYTATQAFARVARDASAGIIVYESVRDPEHEPNVAVLQPRAFGKLHLTRAQTWQLIVTRSHVHWLRAGEAGLSFQTAAWAG